MILHLKFFLSALTIVLSTHFKKDAVFIFFAAFHQIPGIAALT